MFKLFNVNLFYIKLLSNAAVIKDIAIVLIIYL